MLTRTRLKIAIGERPIQVQQLPVIYTNPGILGGQPIFRGTRVTFQTLLDHVEDGGGKTGFEEFLLDFPSVSREQALAALEENKKLHLLK
ncbi:MAG TPA: DUF433 domain-containing protein [Candidatus Angelobacter sp.]|nr:DUF433 domain-containing protein [Candidatus Angelobacter sp.]